VENKVWAFCLHTILWRCVVLVVGWLVGFGLWLVGWLVEKEEEDLYTIYFYILVFTLRVGFK